MGAINKVERSIENAKASAPLSLLVQRALTGLGRDLALARRRRRFTQASMAQRMGASVSTVRRMEKGDPRVPIHFYARALELFGELNALAGLMDSGKDDIGLALADQSLPKRVRNKTRRPTAL